MFQCLPTVSLCCVATNFLQIRTLWLFSYGILMGKRPFSHLHRNNSTNYLLCMGSRKAICVSMYYGIMYRYYVQVGRYYVQVGRNTVAVSLYMCLPDSEY